MSNTFVTLTVGVTGIPLGNSIPVKKYPICESAKMMMR